jgi:molecular chaperone DnaK
MIADAERHLAEDRQLRELADARNELDSVAYQVERGLTELGDAAPVHEKSRVGMLLDDARRALTEQAPLDRVRSLTSELQQAYYSLGAAGAGGAGPDADGTRRHPPGGSGGSDDVIDAEFTTDE